MACPAAHLLAYLGPAIGPDAFEVGDDVRDAFVAKNPSAAAAFKALSTGENERDGTFPIEKEWRSGKWLANIYLLARQSLERLGVDAVYGGNYCTVREIERFFSFRRDGVTGRMASLIWLAAEQ